MAFLSPPRSDSTPALTKVHMSAAQVISIPSPTPSTSSNTGKSDLKRKRHEGPNGLVYSQPQQTGTGQQIMTQIHYAVEYLKEKDRPMSFKDVLGYLSLKSATDQVRQTLRQILRTHRSVEYDKTGLNGQGSFRFRPKHNVRSADDLKGYLQKRSTAQGILVRELKDGWFGALETITDMEKRGDLLVTRNKKDNVAKMVWQNDPSLTQSIGPEFRTLWHSIPLPANPDDLRTKLEQAGLKPTSAPKDTSATNGQNKKKKKAPRRGGRQTNTHMAGILKDYSHKRK